MASRLEGTVGLYARLFVPLAYRDGFAGDLLEQPPKRALIEMARSIPALLVLRLRSLREDGGGPFAAFALGVAFLTLAVAVLQWASRGGTNPPAVLAGLSFASIAYLPISQVAVPVLTLTGAVVGAVSRRAPLRDATLLWLALSVFGFATLLAVGPGFHAWHESLRLLLTLPFLLAGSALAAPRRRRLA